MDRRGQWKGTGRGKGRQNAFKSKRRKRKDAAIRVFPLSSVRGTGVFQARAPRWGFVGVERREFVPSGGQGAAQAFLSEISGGICHGTWPRPFHGRKFLPGNCEKARGGKGDGKSYQFSVIIQAGAGSQPRPLTLLASSIALTAASTLSGIWGIHFCP